MTAMDGGNAIGLHGATLAHYESLLKVTLHRNRPINQQLIKFRNFITIGTGVMRSANDYSVNTLKKTINIIKIIEFTNLINNPIILPS
jgi:hypothetical protein